MCGAPICALRASARRTSVNVSIGWPTCRAIDGTKGQRTLEGVERERERKGGQPPDELPSVVMFAGWATLRANEWKGGKWQQNRETKIRNLTLAGMVDLAGWPTTTTRDCKTDGRDAPNRTGAPSLPGLITVLFLVPTGRRVVLAPEFSLWLMGFPEAWAKAAPNSDAWRAAQAALELECSKDRETQSSPNSPPNS